MESQQWKMRGYRDNEHKLKQEVQTGCKEEIFHEFNQASNGIGCPEWLWNPHIWRISRPTQMKPWATSSKLIAVPALSRRSWDLLRSLPNSVILWFCNNLLKCAQLYTAGKEFYFIILSLCWGDVARNLLSCWCNTRAYQDALAKRFIWQRV